MQNTFFKRLMTAANKFFENVIKLKKAYFETSTKLFEKVGYGVD
jgi:hypothetical protein